MRDEGAEVRRAYAAGTAAVDVNGQSEVPAGGQVKVPGPRG